MTSRREWTLSEAAHLLKEPQHRLIYLCERKVVIPDYGDADGRGSSRRFSERNLLEFSLALKLMEFTISAGTAAVIVYVLRSFEKTVAEQIDDFVGVESFRKIGAPDLRILISDGERLYFSLQGKGEAPKLFGGIDFERLVSGGRVRDGGLKSYARASKGYKQSLMEEIDLLQNTNADPGDVAERFGKPEGSRYTRMEVNVTQLAKDLAMES